MYYSKINLCYWRARAGVWGVRGEPARNKARINDRAWPASAVPPQGKEAGQDRASAVGCVKADDDLGRAKRSNRIQSAGTG